MSHSMYDPSAISAMDTSMSSGAGATKSVEPAIGGLVGVFATLARQHGEVGALLTRVQRDAGKREELWPRIRAELISHEQGEIREVYPVLREYVETRGLAARHDHEAAELSTAIERVEGLALTAPEWGDAFDKIVELVTHHVEDEENEIFPAAQDAIGEDRARELDRKFLAAKAEVMIAATS